VAGYAEVFSVLYSQFLVRDADQVSWNAGDAGVETNGLVSVDAGWLHVHTRVDGGGVHVAAEVYEAAPPVDLAGWEDVAEASVPAPDGCLMLDGVTIGAPEGYPR
jgi:hypothetical protein